LSGPRTEFNRYYREITGRDPADTLLELHVSADVSESGNDAYVLRSTKDGVSVTGSNLRSVYYGVYDLLERRGGCHWFWDGDVVPKRDKLDFSGLDVREEARFEHRAIRYFAHRGLTRFQAEHWGLDDWKTAFTERDAIDLARTMGGRLTIAARDRLLCAYHRCQAGKGPVAEVRERAAVLKSCGELMADVLALHTDYSIAESYDRLDAVEKITNPNFRKVLLENAICSYCFSHQYEAAEHWYRPCINEFADEFVRHAERGDRSRIPLVDMEKYRDAHMYVKTLDEMRPTLPRTQEIYRRTMLALAAAADAVLR